MEVKVTLQTITIKDESSGEEHTMKTLRSAKEIAGYVEESEKDEIMDKLTKAVCDAYGS
jgi:uncharacterized membrane protein YebE (DUF533 family)